MYHLPASFMTLRRANQEGCHTVQPHHGCSVLSGLHICWQRWFVSPCTVS
jgi:hypothetical protein